MAGFRLVVRVGVHLNALETVLERRAEHSELLDPEFAKWVLRAGLGVCRSGLASFVYATSEGAVAVIDSRHHEPPMAMRDRILGGFVARLALLVGGEVDAEAVIYEFPDIAVIRRAFSSLVEIVEESTPARSCHWLGAQLRGRGEMFHPAMIETLEEQTSLLQTHGIDMDALPPWWWRGVAARVDASGDVTIVDDLPVGDALGELVPES